LAGPFGWGWAGVAVAVGVTVGVAVAVAVGAAVAVGVAIAVALAGASGSARRSTDVATGGGAATRDAPAPPRSPLSFAARVIATAPIPTSATTATNAPIAAPSTRRDGRASDAVCVMGRPVVTAAIFDRAAPGGTTMS
jgi:hypothetical protein